MSLKVSFSGKWHALTTFLRLFRFLTNWREVWKNYKQGVEQPPYRFRLGFVIHHGPWDEPIDLLREVIARGTYRKLLSSSPTGVVVDIGANIGMVTSDLASRFPTLQFHCYEPNPATYGTLSRNLSESGFSSRAVAYAQAVGRICGRVEFWVDLPSYMATASAYSLTPPRHAHINTAATARKVFVPLVDFNEVIRRVGSTNIVLLKIDAEGAEADILEGAKPSALDTVACVALEYHGDRCPGALERCKAVLERSGFEVSHQPGEVKVSGVLYASRR